jgi:hypothetical protein
MEISVIKLPFTHVLSFDFISTYSNFGGRVIGGGVSDGCITDDGVGVTDGDVIGGGSGDLIITPTIHTSATVIATAINTEAIVFFFMFFLIFALLICTKIKKRKK